MSRYFNWLCAVLALYVLCAIVGLGAEWRAAVLTVADKEENFRDGPDGEKLGTLLEGAELKKLEQRGKWIRFRLEGWVWGPSLDGFVEQVEKPFAEVQDRTRVPLIEKLPEIKRLINDRMGLFYGVSHDEISSRLVVRFKVQNLSREDLEWRQASAQREVLEILGNLMVFTRIRIETNRPDGTGQVGTEIAETAVEAVRSLGAETDLSSWRLHTRFSSDNGETWRE